MVRVAALALGIVLCFSAAAETRGKPRAVVSPTDDQVSAAASDADADSFPAISKDQSRRPHHANVMACDTTCGGPYLSCYLSECFNTLKRFYCSLPVPFDGGCNCQPCSP